MTSPTDTQALVERLGRIADQMERFLGPPEMAPGPDPDDLTDAKALIEAQAAELSSLRAKLAEAMAALTDATAHLTGAASAYDRHAARHRDIKPRAVADPFFTTRVSDFIKAGDRARSAVRRLIEGNENERV